MCCIDSISTVNYQLLRSKLFEKVGNLAGPLNWDVLIAKYGTSKLVSSFVSKNGRVFCIGKVGIRVPVSQKYLVVVFEIVDDGSIGVKLLDLGITALCSEMMA
jgi:hypothetical protein